MRIVLAAISVILLSGCHQSPNINNVATDTKAELQRQLNNDYADKHATVQKVSVVQTTAPKYEGEATIAAFNSIFTVPLIVTSDGKTTLVKTDGEKLATGFELALQNDLAILVGKYSDYVLSPAMFDMMPGSLKSVRADFSARLNVVSPIDSDGRYYFGSGCAPHECTMNEAAWTIDKNTGKGAAIIMVANPPMTHDEHAGEMAQAIASGKGLRAMASDEETFRLYGATMENLPPPLAAWADQQGMTVMNVVPDTPTYQPPQK
jgi:outer membrane murein-binding lipoprotein Lpp